MLTPQQYRLLLYIHTYLQKTGFSPSFDEMKEALALRSKSGIHRLISGLEERGFLKRRHHRARALEVIKLPDNYVSTENPFYPNRTATHDSTPQRMPSSPSSRGVTQHSSDTTLLPLYGYIAAGLPIESLPDPENTIEVPSSLITQGEHYALTVTGDSMKEAGILEGDTIILRKAEQAENGQIVVALIESEEVTLKEWYQRGNVVALKPANPAYETRLFPVEKIQVQGVLVSLIRHY
ncbi:transcriptional repressor LexA [Entomobacter blattae]|uniref:LexA repressor n=1 Tax=Entomobacter blattae TaxID=2762277 RepID=A0A7H1NSE5_9PROT|nr:transcriptional repressor LexA [Entomobacter blattae]QNT78705.1 LexA repressor [Entomobacter blattae]